MRTIIGIVALLLSVTLWLGCTKKADTDNVSCNYQVQGSAPASEIDALTQYILKDSIDAIQDKRGFYYKIDTTGSSDKPNLCSNVQVNYVGTLTSGKIFDQAQNVQFNMNGLILGWQAGIPLIGKGGKVTLYLPPSFGYGSNELNGIPANSILIFSIDLINFSNP
jgi:FKBP-type peptidyl-prolyl cis-trans isomerase FkpA